jgi:alpha/beta hydrolase fold
MPSRGGRYAPRLHSCRKYREAHQTIHALLPIRYYLYRIYKAIVELSIAICRLRLVLRASHLWVMPMKISTNGIQINIEDRGSGEPVLVFLHYWGGSARTWGEVIDRLDDRHRSIALDHRGWGHSDAPDHGYGLSDLADDARGVIRALKLKRYLVVGHSMGG